MGGTLPVLDFGVCVCGCWVETGCKTVLDMDEKVKSSWGQQGPVGGKISGKNIKGEIEICKNLESWEDLRTAFWCGLVWGF